MVCLSGAEQERDWAAVAAVQCRLDREGGTKLFTDLVMSTKNDKIFQESIQVAICLLEGGNTEIQVSHTLTFTQSCPLQKIPDFPDYGAHLNISPTH